MRPAHVIQHFHSHIIGCAKAIQVGHNVHADVPHCTVFTQLRGIAGWARSKSQEVRVYLRFPVHPRIGRFENSRAFSRANAKRKRRLLVDGLDVSEVQLL